MGWSLVFQVESSSISTDSPAVIRGLQDIEMRQPKLFNADFAVKTLEFRGC